MTPEELAIITSRFTASAPPEVLTSPPEGPEAVLPVTPGQLAEAPPNPPPPARPLVPRQTPAQHLARNLSPEMRAAVDKLPANKEGIRSVERVYKEVRDQKAAAVKAAEEEAAALPQPPGLPAGALTIGDLLDIDPATLPPELAKTVRDQQERFAGVGLQGPQASDDGGRGSVFRSEWGEQQLKNLRKLPLVRSKGALGTTEGKERKALEDLYMSHELRLSGKGISEMSQEEYDGFKAKADDQARRYTASVLGHSEQRENMLIDMRSSEEIVKSIRRGEDLPWWTWMVGIGPLAAGARIVEKLGGPAAEDNLVMNLMAPFLAVAKPGSGSFGYQEGRVVLGAEKESKLNWFFRAAPSTAIASWLLDPKLDWSFGGEKGFGGKDHVAKVASGYDIVGDVVRVGELWDEVTPWDSNHLEKIAAAIIPIGAVVLFEPDAIALSLGVFGPAGKTVKSAARGKFAMKLLILPLLKEMDDVMKAGGSLYDLEKVVGAPGSSKRWVYDAIAGDAIGKIVADAGDARGLGSLHSADPARVQGLAIDATQAMAKAAPREVKAGMDLAGKTAQAASDAHDFGQARDAMRAGSTVATAAMRQGDQVIEVATGKAFEFQSVTVRGVDADWVVKAADGTTRAVTDLQGAFIPTRFFGPPTKAMGDLAKARAQRARLIHAMNTQTLTPQMAARAAAGMAQLNASIAQSITTISFHQLAAMLEATGKAAVKSAAAEGTSAAKFAEVMAKTDTIAARKAALLRASKTTHDVIRMYIKAGEAFIKRVDAGATEAKEIGSFVVDELHAKNLGGPQIETTLLSRYGADPVDDTLKLAHNGHIPVLLQARTHNARGLEELRRFEQEVFGASQRRELGKLAPAEGLLNTLRDNISVRGMTVESWAARSFQALQYLGRTKDLVGAGAVGKSTRIVREQIRIGYERLFQHEREIGTIAKEFGPNGVRDWLTSTRDFGPEVIGNLEQMVPVAKLMAYLRGLKGAEPVVAGGAGIVSMPEAWRSDIVLRAIAGSPLGAWDAAEAAPAAFAASIGKKLDDPNLTPSEFLAFLESEGKAIYARMLGRSDDPNVVLKFIARATAQGANMFDMVYDVKRATGLQIDAATAKGMDWMAVPETVEHVFDVDKALKAAAAYGLPRLSQYKGALKAFGDAKNATNRMIAVGEDDFLPQAVWEAMQAVPRNLAKEMKEFHDPGSLPARTFDKLSRWWRITAVNGWALPRARHYVNTFAGDHSQMVTSVGYIKAMKLALQAAPSYVPFVGPRLQDALLNAASSNSLLANIFNPRLAVLLKGGDDVVIVGNQKITARQFRREALQDGVRDSISTQDMSDALRRANTGWWGKVADGLFIPPHIERSARFLEELQYRQRLALYTDLRMGGKSRAQAHKLMKETLYDFKTGISDVEHQYIGRLSAFWNYRRNMGRQLGAALTEGVSTPTAKYMGQAMTGNTKISRMKSYGRLLSGVPEVIYWDDPEAYADDAEQLRAFGRRVAPWWVDSEAMLFSREINSARKLWYSEVAGRDVTWESILLPSLTTLDQLWLMHMGAQTAAAVTVQLSEAVGLSPNMTTAGAGTLWERNVDSFTDMLMPVFDDTVNNALRPILGKGRHSPMGGMPVTTAQAAAMRRLGWEDFMAAAPDADGTIRVDATAYGIMTNLVLSAPPLADMSRNYLIFANNPGYQESFQTGLVETFGRYTGLFSPHGHDPFRSSDFESAAKERKLREEQSRLRRLGTPVSRR